MRHIFLLFSLLIAGPVLAEETTKANLFKLSYAEAEQVVSAALADKGAAEKTAAFINGRSDDVLYAYTKPLSVETRSLQFDKKTGRWSANLLISAEGQVVTAMPAAGRFDVLAEIPVLKRSVNRGDIIESTNVEIRDIADSQMRSDTVTDMASLIGQSPTYTISAGRPIRQHEIASPISVKKNALIQMHYRSPGMEITTSGQAMEDGSIGQLINVKNLVSKKIIQAQVEDASSVVVATPTEKRVELTAPTKGDSYAAN